MNKTVSDTRSNTDDLRSRFLDAHRRSSDGATLDTVAHMLFEIDRPENLASVGLAYLSRKLSAERVDIGFGSPGNSVYAASAEHCVENGQSTIGLPLPNRNPVLQRVWRSGVPVAYDNIRENRQVASVRKELTSIGIRALIAQRLQDDTGKLFGIVCVDDLKADRAWTEDEQNLLGGFCEQFFAPLVALSRLRAERRKTRKPTAAELTAIRLAAKGYSYKRIAASLNKSLRTIEAQLRSARLRTGAANQTELVRLCDPWL